MLNERYARQIILPEIGEIGQQKLKQCSIVVIGAGGLGSPALLYLASAGIGEITIVDGDIAPDGYNFAALVTPDPVIIRGAGNITV